MSSTTVATDEGAMHGDGDGSAEDAMPAEGARQVVEGARRFRLEVLEPLERRLDLLDDPATTATDPALQAAEVQACEMGLPSMALPSRHGGLALPRPLTVAATEALATGAPGGACRLLGEGTLRAVLAAFDEATPDVARVLLDERVLAAAYVQTDLGSGGTVELPATGLRLRGNRYRSGLGEPGTVRRDGTAVRLERTVLPGVADGARAGRLLLVVVTTDGGPAEVSVHHLDVAAAGVDRRPADRRLGLRLEDRTDITLHGVELDERSVLLRNREAASFLELLVAATSLHQAAVAVGLASRSYEHAHAYTRTRVQGGRPIVEHQSVARALWEATGAIETTRLALAAASDVAGEPGIRAALAVRDSAVTMARRVSLEMLELLGGYGVVTEYPQEKLYRDASTLASSSGSLEGLGVFGRTWLP